MKNRSENARTSACKGAGGSDVNPLPLYGLYFPSHTFQRRTITQGV
jgi:hypothetical protein